jgi:DNA polymerase I-like protein with 3'-5' exonuclease and polymerase domains
MPEMHQEVRFRPHSSLLPDVAWRPPRANELPSWKDARRVSIDLETRDELLTKMGPGCRRKGNYVVGIGFAIEDGPEHYLPIRHDGGDNCDFDAWQYVQDQIRDFGGVIVGNGVEYELDWLCQPGGEGGPSIDVEHPILKKRIMDVQHADVMINELHDRYNLEVLCQRHGLPGKDETHLRQVAAIYRADPKLDLWRFRGRDVAQYCMVDARRPLQLLRRQEQLIEEEGVQSIWELEQQVTPIVVKMRRRGLRVDPDKLEHIEQRSLEVEKECLEKVRHATGVSIDVGDVWRADVLAHALRAAGHDVPKTASGAHDSVDKIVLKKCGQLGEWITRARGWSKLRTTFAKQVRDHMVDHGAEGWRVHCTFNQLRANADEEGGKGVRYGRFSSTDFNIQAQPVRDDEYGDLWRSVYVADFGKEWVCSDWSQQEPRIGVHYAELLGLPGAKEFADAYRANPRLDIHQKLADLSGIVRKIVKNYVNGRLYGMGDAKLCRSIDKPTEWRTVRGEQREVPGPEGQEIIDQFDQFAPWVRGLVRAAARQAEKVGHVWTILRRKCRFLQMGGKYDRTHKAFSRVGQGGAADQMKATLVEADKADIPVQASIHDEFDYSETRDKIGRERRDHLKHLQLTVVQFSVPMLVDQEIGESWGELHKDEELN